MKNQELKKILVESFQLEENLVDFCKECINRIYKDQPKLCRYILNEFDDYEQSMDYNGCIQPLDCLEKNAIRQWPDLVDSLPEPSPQ